MLKQALESGQAAVLNAWVHLEQQHVPSESEHRPPAEYTVDVSNQLRVQSWGDSLWSQGEQCRVTDEIRLAIDAKAQAEMQPQQF